ncbi:MAG: hypothetical protein AAF721_19935 [Myxococcota bacterium]
MLTFSCGDSDSSIWESAGGDTSGNAEAGDDDGQGEQGDGGGTAADGTTDDGGDDGGGVKLDVGPSADDGGGTGLCGCEHTYIWVANAEESTVSKINTRTMEEEGRYLTREDGAGNPSRTSVNLVGDVAVANRAGGLAKFWADVDNCVDRNGDGTIQTSTGKADVLPWAAEECRAWYSDFNTTNQRPVAWTGGQILPDACDVSSAQIWTVTSATPGFPGQGGAGGVIAYLVDGETGLAQETIPIPEFNGALLGAYGGAVDKLGTFWFTSIGFGSGGQLARVSADTLEYEIFMTPNNVQPYGITVDHKGRPWVSSTLGEGAGRFDYATQEWGVVTGFFGGSGLTEGPTGELMYISAGDSVYAVDLETLDHAGTWTTTQSVKGVGFDVDGYLWAITWADPEIPGETAPAYKVDVDTMSVQDVYMGLDYPYTYSDMTGSALGNVTCPPEG